MTGLILKDFLCLRKTLRSYLLISAMYAAIAFSGAWPPSIVGTLMVVMVAILPMNVFSYDQQARWDIYGLALPVGRTKTVAARYVCVLLLILFSVGLTAASGAALYIAGRIEDTAEFIISCAVLGLMAVLLNAALLPFLYKFGPERARMMFFGSIGALVLAGWLFLIPLGGLNYLKTIEAAPTAAQVYAIPFIAAAAGVVLLVISFLLSRHFYGAKDI